MARYEREFLVPYLEDICALYMCENVLRRKVYLTTRQIVEIEAPPMLQGPKMPVCDEPWENGNKFKVFGSLVIFLLSIFNIADAHPLANFLERLGRGIINMACGLGLVISPIVFIWGIVNVIKTKNENAEILAVYNEQLARYKQQWEIAKAKKDEQQKNILPEIIVENAQYSRDLEECQKLIDAAYDADVISTKYRNEYAVMYLYDWFKHNRRADDLDAALNTYVLEQIKDKLDKMIQQLEEVIINQRMMIANQRASMEEQRRHHAYMEEKVKQIAANQEEQAQYMEMIESNTAISAFFNTVSYIQDR